MFAADAVGPKSGAWLADAGVVTLEDLRSLGALETYRRVKACHPEKVSLNLLWALEGALTGKKWHEIPPERKEELRRELGHNA